MADIITPETDWSTDEPAWSVEEKGKFINRIIFLEQALARRDATIKELEEENAKLRKEHERKTP